MTSDESTVVVLPPAVDRYAMLPGAQIQAAVTDPVGGHPIRQADSYLGMRADNQLMQPIEQRAMRGRDAIDITAHLLIHLYASPGTASIAMIRKSQHGGSYRGRRLCPT